MKTTRDPEPYSNKINFRDPAYLFPVISTIQLIDTHEGSNSSLHVILMDITTQYLGRLNERPSIYNSLTNSIGQVLQH